MDQLSDILANKQFNEPPEIRAIKDYTQLKFDSKVKVALSKNQLIVSAPSASLIASLRANLPELIRAADTDKKIIFRIG